MACPFSTLERNKANGTLYYRPCGSCMHCRIEHRTEWEFRISTDVMYEYTHNNNFSTFTTLTYADPFLTFNKNGQPTLNNKDIEDYHYRLDYITQKLFNRKFKRYTVTEYGDTFGRPHAHQIIIGLDPKYNRTIATAWLKGRTLSLPVQNGGIRYVLKYMDKQIFRKEDIEKAFKDHTPPNSWKSHGIGKQYIIEHADELIENNGYVYHGKKHPLTQYMKDYLSQIEPSLYEKQFYYDKQIALRAEQQELNYLDEKNYISALSEISYIKTSLIKDGVADHENLRSLDLLSHEIMAKKTYGKKTLSMALEALGA